MKTELDTPRSNAAAVMALANQTADPLMLECQLQERKNFALASQLAECAGYLASVNTARTLEHNEETWALQTLDWARGAAEIAARSNAVLAEFDNIHLEEPQP